MDEEEEEETEELKPIAVETKVSDTGGCAKALGVTVPAAAVNKEFDAVVGELAGSLRLPGFRPGKVPRQLIEKRFAEAIRDRVTTDIVKRAVSTALSKERLDVVGEPKLDVKNLPKVQRGQPFSFSLDLEVRPAFELSNYKGLVVEQEEVELLPEEVEEGILRLRERFSEFVDLPPEHPIGNRNLVKGTLRFTVEGKEVHQAEEQLFVMDGLVLGAHAQLKEEFLQGAKVGEKRSTAATLDEGFPVAEYRGKNATIDLEIASIKQQTLLPAGDALAQKVGLKTLEELQARVRSELLEKLSDEVRSRTEHELLERIVSATPFELPKRLQDTLSHANKERSLEQLKEMGIDVASLGEHRAMFESKAKDQAAAEIRRWFVMDAICAKEGITVSDEDIDQEIVRLARARNMRASDLYDKLRDTDQLERLEAQLKTQKLLEFLVQEAAVESHQSDRSCSRLIGVTHGMH
ncbi:MAG: trigger factor [Planctomycetota bacterium]